MGYEEYLQYPNTKIQQTADMIVAPSVTDDEEMYKIEEWVKENITYKSDIEGYGMNELWAYPTVTLNRKTGDCEDGALLIHSLALHAGVLGESLRTYGGIVETGLGAEAGGHAWTAYRRETDDKWVVVDWCYYPTETPIAERIPMKDNLKYIDDYFFVDATKTVQTPLINRVRFAGIMKGALIDYGV